MLIPLKVINLVFAITGGISTIHRVIKVISKGLVVVTLKRASIPIKINAIKPTIYKVIIYILLHTSLIISILLEHIHVCALAATLVRLCVPATTAAPVTEPHKGSAHGPPGGPCALT